MHTRTAPGSTNGGDIKLKLPAPGDLVFIYDGGPGLVTRLEGWALSMVELLFGDGIEATHRRMVGVYRNPAGDLDIAAFVTPLAAAETAWHLVSPAGDIVNGGPRGNGTRPSQSQAELEAVRDSGRYASHAGAVAAFGIPDTSQYAPSVDAEGNGTQAPVDGGFTAARGGQYRWHAPEPAVSEDPAQKATETPETVSVEPVAQERTEILRLADTPQLSNGFDTTLAPYGVWITYRRETGASEHTWTASVSGYRVLVNGVVDMDATSIELWSTTDDTVTPDWLMRLIEGHAPSW